MRISGIVSKINYKNAPNYVSFFDEGEKGVDLCYLEDLSPISNDIRMYLNKKHNVSPETGGIATVITRDDVRYISTIMKTYDDKEEWISEGRNEYDAEIITNLLLRCRKNLRWLYYESENDSNCEIVYYDVKGAS